MKIGFHIPFSGNIKKLEERVRISRGNVFQIFARSLRGIDKSGNPVKLQRMGNKKIKDFKEFMERKKIKEIFVHAPYSYDFTKKITESRGLMLEDLEFAQRLGANYYILQPGYYKNEHPLMAVEHIKKHLTDILEQTEWNGTILIKNMAGAGTELCFDLTQWNELISFHPRIKGVLDLARIYSAGYDFTNKEKSKKFIENIGEEIGWEKIRAIYINDIECFCGEKKNKYVPLGEGIINYYGYEPILAENIIKEKIWLVENQPTPTHYDNTIDFLMKF